MTFDIKICREIVAQEAERYDVLHGEVRRIQAFQDELPSAIGTPAPDTPAALALSHREELQAALDENCEVHRRVLEGIAGRLDDTVEMYNQTEDENVAAARAIWTGSDGTPPPAASSMSGERHTEKVATSSGVLADNDFPGSLPRDMETVELADAVARLDWTAACGPSVLRPLLEQIVSWSLHLQTLEEAAESWLPVHQFGVAGKRIGLAYDQYHGWTTTDQLALQSGWSGAAGDSCAQYLQRTAAWQAEVSRETGTLVDLSSMATAAYLLQCDLYDHAMEIFDDLFAAVGVGELLRKALIGGAGPLIIEHLTKTLLLRVFKVSGRVLAAVTVAVEVWRLGVMAYDVIKLAKSSRFGDFGHVKLETPPPTGL